MKIKSIFVFKKRFPTVEETFKTAYLYDAVENNKSAYIFGLSVVFTGEYVGETAKVIIDIVTPDKKKSARVFEGEITVGENLIHAAAFDVAIPLVGGDGWYFAGISINGSKTLHQLFNMTGSARQYAQEPTNSG